MVGLLEYGAGILFSEPVVAAQLRLARGGGAALRTGDRHLKGGSMKTVVELVSGGQGYTVLPAMAADAIAKRGYEGVVVEFSAPVPAREISLVHRRGYLKRGIEQVLRSTIDACLPSGVVPRTSAGLNVLSLMGQFK